MGHILKRRSKTGVTRYYGKLRVKGAWTTRALTGCTTLAQARDMLGEAERRSKQGLDPFPAPIAVVPPPAPVPLVGELLTQWAAQLTNVSAQADRWRVNKHLIPRLGQLTIEQLTVLVVVDWLKDLSQTTQSRQTALHQFSALSRFFGWCTLRGLTTSNPCKMVPLGARPRVKVSRDRPWLQDDSLVLTIMESLGQPLGLMFYLGNRSGLRQGEAAGLRLSDLAWLTEGTIRVRYSYNAKLKEDRNDLGQCKWVPAPTDAMQVLGPWLLTRRAAGALDESLVFPYTPPNTQNKRRVALWATWAGYHPHHIYDCWAATANALGIKLTWNQATRHTFASRSLTAGSTLDETSAALGHASIETTRRSYDHFIRKSFSDVLRKPLVKPE